MNYKNPINITDLPGAFSRKIDLFICSASFEERCLEIPKQISEKNPKNVIICRNANHYNFNNKNFEKIIKLFNKPKCLDFISNEPIRNAIIFIDQLIKLNLNSKSNILIDITTFTHETLLILFRYLKIRFSQNISCIYIDAIDYSTNVRKPENKWLSKGIGEIRSVLGFPGIISPARKNHLIIIFGFESERTRKLIETYESNIVSLAFGPRENSTQYKHYELNYIRHRELLRVYPDSYSFEVSLIDPVQTKKDIISQINKFPNTNVIIAPMNNKISTLGTALTALEDNNVQLTYVSANQYNIKNYSEAGTNCYLFNL